MPWVSFVLLNYNSGDYVQAQIDSLAAQKDTHWELIVVDNGSTDTSLARILNRVEYHSLRNWRSLLLKQNLHFAVGMNRGIELAIGEIVVPLNADVYLHDSFVDVLRGAYQRGNEEVGMFVGTEFAWIWNGEPSELTQTTRATGISLTRRLHVSRWDPIHDSEDQLLGPSGCAPPLLRDVLEKIKLPNGDYYDSRFVAFGEDIDLFLRIRARGYRPCFVSDLKFWHIGSAAYGDGSLSFMSKPAPLVGRVLANKWRIWRQMPSLGDRVVTFPIILLSNLGYLLQLWSVRGKKPFWDCLSSYLRVLRQILLNERKYSYVRSPNQMGLYSGWFSARSANRAFNLLSLKGVITHGRQSTADPHQSGPCYHG